MDMPSSEHIKFSYDDWRAGFLRITLIIASVFGLVAVIPAVIGVLKTSPIYAVVYVGVYLAVLLVTVINVPYSIKAGIFTALIFGLGVSGLLETGIWGDSRVFMLGAITLAAMLFSWRVGWAMTGLTMLSYVISGWLVINGIMPITSKGVVSGDLSTWVSGSVSVLLLAVLIVNSIRLTQTEFRKAQERAESIFGELKNERNTLEKKVAERTAVAESARAAAEISANEAESARKNIEAQVWLATGQTQLADAMRGEQDISQLAENVISQLCQYTGVQAGALFLLKEKTLTLAGRYAFAEISGFDGKFQLGEGLVGQAAADGKVMSLQDIPSDTLVISTGLVDVKPRQIAAAPFRANGEVVGVIELATFSAFTQTHLELWNRTSESIGVAFRTAQTRQRLANLLEESQRQAEELQAQEEELRAANEELHAQAENLKSARKFGVKMDES